MKKCFSIMMGLLFMTTLQAANTEVVRVTLTGNGGTESSFVTLRVDPAVNPAEVTSYFGATDEIGQVNIYALNGSDKVSAIKKDDLTGVELQIITNRRAASDQHYTLTFNVPTSTVGLKLLDRMTGIVTTMTHNGTYEFDVNTTLHPDFVAGTNYVIKDRFVINGTPVAESLCFNNNILEVNGYAGKSLVIKQGASEIENIPSLPAMKSISLGAYTGRLVVTLDGKDYQIDVNPTVTSYTPAP